MAVNAGFKNSTFLAALQNYHRYCWATSVIMYWGDAMKLFYIMWIRGMLKHNKAKPVTSLQWDSTTSSVNQTNIIMHYSVSKDEALK